MTVFDVKLTLDGEIFIKEAIESLNSLIVSCTFNVNPILICIGSMSLATYITYTGLEVRTGNGKERHR